MSSESMPTLWQRLRPPALVLTLALLVLQALVLRLTRGFAIEQAKALGDDTLIALALTVRLMAGLWFGVVCLGVLAVHHLFSSRQQGSVLVYRPPARLWGMQGLVFGGLMAAVWLVPSARTLRWFQALPFDASVAASACYLVLTLLWLALIAASGLLLAPRAYWGGFFRTHGAGAVAIVLGTGVYLVSEALLSRFESLWYETFLSPTLRLSTAIGKAIGLDIVAQPRVGLFGTSNFVVDVGGACLGYQSISILLLVLLSYFYALRKELRFPQVFAVLPGCIAALLLLNAARIALLVGIGDHWSGDIAVLGFHSTAGWVELIGTIAGALYLLNRSPIFTRRPAQPLEIHLDDNEFCLMPQVVLIATAFVMQLFTGSFYWTYPVPIVVTALFAWHFRHRLPALDWGAPGLAVLAGLGVCVFWIAWIPVDPQDSQTFATELFRAPSWLASGWILLRLLGSALVVPLVEELAFRGFLWGWVLRRVEGHLPPRLAAWAALAVTSLVFGLLHGHWWVAALAGMCYGLVYMRRGRLADAVLAHAVTNGVLGLYAMATGEWAYW